MTRRLVAEFARRRPPAGADSRLAGLTARETDVLRLIARGMSNAEIAAALFVEVTTIKSHVASLLTKLGLRDRIQAVVLAYEHGLITPGDSSSTPGTNRA